MSTEEFNFSVNLSYGEDIIYKTLVTPFESGKEQRRQKWPSPRRIYTVRLAGRQQSEVNRMWDFFRARNGAFDTFYFENPNESPISGELIGSGNGSTTVFNTDYCPLISGSPTAIKYDGTTIDSSNYTVNRATGTITMYVAPSGGITSITADYNPARVVRFVDDKLPRELISFKLYNTGVQLIEVI